MNNPTEDIVRDGEIVPKISTRRRKTKCKSSTARFKKFAEKLSPNSTKNRSINPKERMKKARAVKNKLMKTKSPQTSKAQKKESNRDAQKRCRMKVTPNTNRKRLDDKADKARKLYYATSSHDTLLVLCILIF